MDGFSTEDLGDLPDDDIELSAPTSDHGRDYWVFVSHTAENYGLIKNEVISESPRNFFLLNYRVGSKVMRETYKRKILSALSSCGWFAIAATNAATRSKWVSFEVRWAFMY